LKPRDHRLFTRGFLGFPAAEPPTASSDLWSAIDGRWKRTEFHDLVIRHHPRTPVAVAGGEDCSVMLLGDAFESDHEGDASGLLSRLLPGKRWLAKRSIAQALAGSSEAELHQRLLTLSGRFALLVRRGERTRVYHDPFGSRTVYYLDGGPHAFGSHVELLAAAYGLARSEAVRELIAMPEVSSRLVQYLPGDVTLCDGVRGLPPNHFVELTTRRVERFWPVAAVTATTFDQLFSQVDSYLAGLTRFLAAKEIVLGITGGVDGRVILAGLLARKARVTGVTWHGSMWLDRREIPILQAVVRIARITNIPIPIPVEDDSGVAALASFNAGRWGPNFTAPMAEIYGHNPRAVFVRGYGGEIMRGFYNFTRVQMVDASPRELMRAYGSGIPQKLRPVSPEYERLCLPFFERWAETTGIEAACRLGYDHNDIFYWEHRMGMWGASMLNELDPALHNLVGHNSRAIYATCFGLPREERLTKDLFMRLVARYDPRLTEPGYR